MKKSRGKQNRKNIEICILAGGLSQRMGRDKVRLRLGNRTVLSLIKAEARKTKLPVRVIRHDVVPRCGPLGGVLTALQTSPADAVLFLACDTPFITCGLLTFLLSQQGETCALFVRHAGRCGFPFMISVDSRSVVRRQIDSEELSLQALARKLKARKVTLSGAWSAQLENLNTPENWKRAKQRWAAEKSRTAR